VKMWYIFIGLSLGLIDSVITTNGHWLRVLEMLGTLRVETVILAVFDGTLSLSWYVLNVWWHNCQCMKSVCSLVDNSAFFNVSSILINRLVQ
jgi:hypothetical protein